MEVDVFLREANLMKKLNHKNLVQLIGVCTQESPIYIIVEFLEGGNLLTYLRDGEKSKDPDAAMLKNFATQVASAMMYLEEMKLIHRLGNWFITGSPVHIFVKEKIALKIALNVSSVNGPLNNFPFL
jgi:Ni,Fe-hydrogenase I cytochrome b subunit